MPSSVRSRLSRSSSSSYIAREYTRSFFQPSGKFRRRTAGWREGTPSFSDRCPQPSCAHCAVSNPVSRRGARVPARSNHLMRRPRRRGIASDVTRVGTSASLGGSSVSNPTPPAGVATRCFLWSPLRIIPFSACTGCKSSHLSFTATYIAKTAHTLIFTRVFAHTSTRFALLAGATSKMKSLPSTFRAYRAKTPSLYLAMVGAPCRRLLLGPSRQISNRESSLPPAWCAAYPA